MSKLYLRNTSVNSYGSGTFSTALPAGSAVVGDGISSFTALDLSTTAGSTQTSRVISTLAQTGQQSVGMMKTVAPALAVSTISANTWTLGVALAEANTSANAFLAVSLYVQRNVSPFDVLGYVYDSATNLGVEWALTEDGQVVTFAGAAVAGITSQHRLNLEVWAVCTQAMASAYNLTLYWDGTADVTDATTTNAGSYLNTPQDLFTAPAASNPPKIPHRYRNGLVMRGRR